MPKGGFALEGLTAAGLLAAAAAAYKTGKIKEGTSKSMFTGGQIGADLAYAGSTHQAAPAFSGIGGDSNISPFKDPANTDPANMMGGKKRRPKAKRGGNGTAIESAHNGAMPEGGMGSLDRLHPVGGSDSMLGGAKHAKHAAKHKKLLKSAEQLKKLLHSITKKIGGDSVEDAEDAEDPENGIQEAEDLADSAEGLATSARRHADNMINSVPLPAQYDNTNGNTNDDNTNFNSAVGGKKKSKPKAKKPKAKKMGSKEILGAGLDAITGGY
jgi:hypothetical protein